MDTATMPALQLMDVQSLYKAIAVINQLALELDIDAAMSSVRRVALELLECDRVTLFLIIESKQELRAKTADAATITVKFGEGIAGSVAQHGGLVNIEDAYSNPLFNPEVDRMTKYRTKSVLCCAIADKSGKNIAVLQALNKRSGAFTNVDEQQLHLFGVHLGNALAKSRFYEEAKRERNRLATLNKCFKRLNAAKHLNSALDTIAAAVKDLVFARHVVVLLMDAAHGVLWTSIANLNTAGEAKLFRVKEGEGIIGRCAAVQKQVALCSADQPSADEQLLKLFDLLAKRRRKLSDVLLQPVVDPGSNKCMAVLCALNKQEQPVGMDIFYEHTFTRSDCEALSVFSMEVADMLSQHALEVSFASAMSGTMIGAGAAQEQLTSMLKAQLLDYYNAPESSASEEHGSGLLHSCASIAGPHIRVTKDMDVEGCLADALLPAALRRCSSTAEEPFTGACSPPASPLSPARSFHHHLPSILGRSVSVTPNLRSQLLTWELDCAKLSRDELVRLAYDIFIMSGVLQELDLPVTHLSKFLSAVAHHYHDVPYHNLAHVVQVLHTVWMILETTTARNVLSAGEELVLLVAAICHDLDHDGFTNSYHINSQSELAQRYNDRSVQENHHCALTFQLLRTSGNMFAAFTDRAEWQAARRLLVDAILSTDMHSHFALTQELQKHSVVFLSDVEADRVLLVKAILHAADISNPVRPFHVALSSAERVHTEFKRQVQRERELGLPIAPHMDTSEPAVWAQMELQFMDYVVGPLWNRLVQIFPVLQQPIHQMNATRSKFLEMSQDTSAAPISIPEHHDDYSGRSSDSSSSSSSSNSKCTFFTGSNRRPRSGTPGPCTTAPDPDSASPSTPAADSGIDVQAVSAESAAAATPCSSPGKSQAVVSPFLSQRAAGQGDGSGERQAVTSPFGSPLVSSAALEQAHALGPHAQ